MKQLNNVLEEFNQVANLAKNLYPNLSQSTIKLLNYSENATYLVENPELEDKYILRIYRPGSHCKSEIEGELYFIDSIYHNTVIETSSPIEGKDKSYIQTLRIENHPNEYYCVLFSFLNGKTLDINNEHELIELFEKIGKITAHFHEHIIDNGAKFNNIKRQTWDNESILGKNPNWGNWEDGIAITPERYEIFKKVADIIEHRLLKFGKTSNRFGLIHADLRHANLLINDKEVKVIDFDDCGFSWYLFDLAASLTFIDHKSYASKLIEVWLKGYRKVRILSKEEEQEIPTFLMLRRFQMISWFASHESELTQEMGLDYTEQTEKLCYQFLENYNYYEKFYI
ncbi:phosphotransferase [Priestia aryabhattai]|uniref:phosphotransferase enzyme family protein n=1 Tax=Priestia aryabhattai TaxID=412384 RepID=UPI003981A8E8